MQDPQERVHINAELIATYLTEPAQSDQDSQIFCVVEVIAETLGEMETHYHAHDFRNLQRSTDQLTILARKYGFYSLDAVARDVLTTLNQTDFVALGAVLTRLLRVGEQSLYAIWDLPRKSVE
jgi:hypothetical protein